MIANVKRTNTGKVLIGILALFVVVAGAAVVLSDSEADALTTQTTMPASGALTDDYVVNLIPTQVTSGSNTLYLGVNGDSSSGTTYNYTTTSSVTVTVNLNSTNDLTSMFRNVSFTVGENVTLIFNMTASSVVTNNHILWNSAITVNGGTVIFQQSANAQGQSWYNDDNAITNFNQLNVTAGSVIFNGANGFSGVVADVDGGIVDFRSTMSARAAINFAEGSDFAQGSTLSVSDSKTYINIGGSTAFNGAVNASASDLVIPANSTLTIGANAEVSVATMTQNGSVTGTATNIDAGTISTSTLENAIKMLDTYDEVTLSDAGELTIDSPVQILVGKTLNIVNTTITEGTSDVSTQAVTAGDAKIIVVTGTLNLDNSYIYCGVYVDEKAGGIVNAINVHNLESNGTLNDSTKVGFGDTLTLSGTIPSNVTLDVYGTLVASDVSVLGTINTYVGSTVSVTGSITVSNEFNLNAGASMELTGTITVRNDTAGGAEFTLADQETITYDLPNSKTRTVTLSASVTVTTDGTFNVNRATANAAANNPNSLNIGTGAEFVVEGSMTVTGQLSGIVQDKGTITFNGTAVSGAGIVLYDGVSITITSVAGPLVVSDDNNVLLDYYGVDSISDLADTTFSSGNSVTLTNVRGVTITEEVSESYSDDNEHRYAVTNMTVTGTVAKIQNNSIATGTLVISNACNDAEVSEDEEVLGTMSIVDNFAVGSDVQVTVRGPVSVEGEVSVIAEDAVMVVDTGAELTVNGNITVSDESGTSFTYNNAVVNAVMYTTTDASDASITTYYTGFANAIDNIADADEDTVNVLGSVVVSADDEVPNGATVNVQGQLVIDLDVTLTVADGALLNITSSARDAVDVNGTLVINNSGTGLAGNINNMSYDVYSLVGIVATYTSLANALNNADPGETITLSQNVELDTNITIPEQVTLQTGRYEVKVNDGVTITVNGTFAVQNGGSVVAGTDSNGTAYVWGDHIRIVVNGVMSDASTEIENLKTYYISGAYYTSRGVNYVTGIAYAAENVHDVNIDIYGQVSAGDIAFSADRNINVTIGAFTNAGNTGHDNIPVTNVAVGSVGLDGVTLIISTGTNISFTGAVTGADAEGTATVDLSRANGVTVQSAIVNTVDGAVDYLYISGTGTASPTTNVAVGEITISSGTVTAGAAGMTVSGDSSIAVADGATFDVPANATVATNAGTNGAVTLDVDGTMNVAGNLDVAGTADIAGTLNIAGIRNSDPATVDVTGTMNVTGTVSVSTDENTAGRLNIGASTGTDTSGVLNVGSKPAVLGQAVAGTVTGNIAALNSNSIVKVYYGGSVDGVTYGSTGATLADATALGYTAYYINDTEYMTVYALTSNTVDLVGSNTSAIYSDMVGNTSNANLQLNGLNTTGANTETNWFSDAEMTTAISSDADVGDVPAIYMSADASVLTGTVSAGTGLVIYIDNVAQTSANDVRVSYGTHVVTFDVRVGYDGSNAVMTFNGQTIQSGDTITVTESGFTLTVTGAVPATYTGGDSGSSDGMGLTDYLLIILVVLIVIMAIMVAMRLMRS